MAHTPPITPGCGGPRLLSPRVARRSRGDRVLRIVVASSALLAASLVLVMLVFVARESGLALQTHGPGEFLTSDQWHPTDAAQPEFGLLAMIAATLATSLGALAFAGPLGIATGLFGALLAPPRFARLQRALIEVLAGIPSVVFGLWGLVVLVPLIGAGTHSGQGLLAASVVLGLMLLPTIALSTEAALQAVPRELLRGGAALGLGPFARAWRVALPAAKRGIVAGFVLAVGRAIGETMAVLMVAGNTISWPAGLREPLRTMTGNIALEMGYATTGHRSALFVVGLVLMLGVTLTVGLAALVRRRGAASPGVREVPA